MKPLIPTPRDIRYNDIVQWFHNGWVVVDTDEGQRPAAFIECDPERRALIHVEYIGEDMHLHSHWVPHSECYPWWPDCGALNLNGYAVFLERIQRRQYRRTYNNQCLDIDVPRLWDAMRTVGHKVVNVSEDDAEVVLEAFNPTYYCWEEAQQKLEEGWFSVALNPHVIVVGEPQSCYVYYRGDLMGHIDGRELSPIATTRQRARRLLKYFDGGVVLCSSESSSGRYGPGTQTSASSA